MSHRNERANSHATGRWLAPAFLVLLYFLSAPAVFYLSVNHRAKHWRPGEKLMAPSWAEAYATPYGWLAVKLKDTSPGRIMMAYTTWCMEHFVENLQR